MRKHQTRPGAGANHPLAIASARSDLPPIVYLDCIVIKIRDKLRVINKAIYLALCVNMDGKKELLGLNILRPASSCASFTCYVINLKYVSWKDYKAVTVDLKRFTKPVQKSRLWPSWSALVSNRRGSTLRSPNHGLPTGSICVRCLITHQKSARRSIRPMPLSLSTE